MTDNELIKVQEEALRVAEETINRQKAEIDILIRKKETLRDEIAEQQAEIERLQKLQKPTETSGFHIVNGNVIFYTNILNGYRYEYKNLDEVVKELNLMLHQNYSSDEIISHYKGKLKTAKVAIESLRDYNENLQTANTALSNEILDAKAEAYKEFAERLKEEKGRFPMQLSNSILLKREKIWTENDIDSTLTELTERKEDEGK